MARRAGLAMLAMSFAATMSAASAYAAGQKLVVPAGAVPVSAEELKQIYDNKTWQWSTGGGRFSDSNRSFVAWSSTDGVDTFGAGHWELTNSGKLCMVATWTTKDAAGANKTCFKHLKVGDVIYQRREPNGKWYVFKAGPQGKNDEYSKLVAEDTVSIPALRIQTRLASK